MYKPISGLQGRPSTYGDLLNMSSKVYDMFEYSNVHLILVEEKHRGYYKCHNGRHNEYVYYLEVLGNI